MFIILAKLSKATIDEIDFAMTRRELLPQYKENTRHLVVSMWSSWCSALLFKAEMDSLHETMLQTFHFKRSHFTPKPNYIETHFSPISLQRSKSSSSQQQS